MTDHARGCEGRNYSCTCGFDDRQAATITALSNEVATLQAEVERLTKLGERFDAPGGNLFTYVAELEAKLAALERTKP